MPEQIEYALTPMQHGMLYHTLRSPGTGVYIAQLSMRISGAEIDVDAFRRAWQEEVGQHDALRTAFHLHGRSQPVQVVHPHVTVPLSQHDWRHRTSDEQAVGLEHFLLNDRMRGFDFSQAPLMRLALLRMADDRFQLIWSLHHAILDGWSTHRVLAEAFQRYEICRVGRSLHLNPPRPYRDYVGWLERQDLAAAETFWRHELKGFIAPTPFGVDRPAHQAHHEDLDVDERRVQFSPAMTRDLRYLARRLRITLNTLIQGTWALLLSRYSGEQDVIFGVTVTGRAPELAGVESMIGLLINTLPFRANVRPEETLESYLQTLLRTQGKLLPYQHTPLVKAQAWSEVPRGLPLFESVLVFQNLPAEQI